MFRTLLQRVCFNASFSKLVGSLVQIKNTSSTRQKKKIMNTFLNSCDVTEKDEVLNIFKFIINSPSIQIRTPMIKNILKEKYFEPKDKLSKDLNLIMDELEDASQEEGTIETSQVNQILSLMISTSGQDSLKTKKTIISDTLDKMSLKEAKIFLRILTKSLKIGMSDKALQKILEQQQEDLTNNTTKEGQPKFQVRFLELMLAKPLKNIEEVWKFLDSKAQKNIYADLKYDGERTLIIYKRGTGIELMSRRRKLQTSVYSPLVRKLEQQLDSKPEITSIQIDGQIMCINPKTNAHLPLQTLISKRGKTAMQWAANQECKVVVFCFDVIELNGEILYNHQLSARRQHIPQTQHILQCESTIFKYPEEKKQILDLYTATLAKGLEGLILKGEKDNYHINGSRKHWGKFKKGCKISEDEKTQIDLDLVVMGAYYGVGKRKSVISSYLVGVYHEGSLYPLARVGTGFTDQQLQEYTQLFEKQIMIEKPSNYDMPKSLSVQIFLQPNYVFKVTCQNFTRSPLYRLDFQNGIGGISMRFPVFQGIRDDKEPSQCTSEDVFAFIEEEDDKVKLQEQGPEK